jgi:DNA invertase Pin-like site-specific DNA recombinase
VRATPFIVWRLDRLARSTRDLLETMDAIREGGARFQSLTDTTTYAGKADHYRVRGDGRV